MVNKLIILGMDGLDFDVIKKYRNFLPNFSKYLDINGWPRMDSIFPADTTPAWSSVYLGVDPTYHGIVNFVNIKDKENSYKPLIFDDSVFRGKTFWDELNKKGLSTAVVLPMNIKEGWKINGLMITRPYHGNINVFPNEKKKIFKPNNYILGTDAKFTSQKKLGKLFKLFIDKADEEIRLTKEVAEKENVDVMFSYLSTPDGVQHDFWSCCDENHIDYNKNCKYKDAIRIIYEKMDNLLGYFTKLYPSIKILVFSDHGHGARPVKSVRINEILKREGYLVPFKSNSNGNSNKTLKQKLFKIIRKIGLPSWLVKIIKKVPVWKKILVPSNIINWNETIAYLSDLSAVKNYSYGGIKINSNIKNKNDVADEVILKLKKYQVDGKPLFQWIMRTNLMYHGPFLYKYPEIIFQMNENYGAGWDFGDNLFSDDGSTHLIFPGGHRYSTATIISVNFALKKQKWNLLEMHDLILDLCKG